jgi:glycosyltransferase involved in cell wall biosynthesis
LIEAMPSLGDDVSLIVCGDGDPEFTASLKDMAHGLGVGEEIDWRGYVGPEARQELFDSVDWIVMPSDYECFGMAAAEALSAGVPVVVSRQTGVAPIVEDNRCGFVVDLATSEGSLGPCLRELKESTTPAEWAELSRNALRATRRSLTYEAYRSAIWPLYESLIRSRAK